jgi:hypothetical protein
MSEEIRNPAGGELTSPGPYLARVVSHLDRTYSGYLQVEILQEAGNTRARQGQLHSVRYLSPFSGQTGSDYLSESNDYNNTQKAYGFWMVPPDPGAIVVVIFIDGDPKKGFWIGCVHDMNMNFSVPGHAATSFHVDGKKARVPVAEYNKLASSPIADTTKIKKPANKLQDKLLNQGTLEDDTRGITTSSARREIPSMVFGISTPGPTDKAGKQGSVGKHEYRIPNAFVSRLGGSEFVMDDGDDKWEREKTPSEGPPVYKSVEDGQTGLRDRPHNELMRFRTRTGHQILMHNSEDLMYIGNSRGTAWIELTSDGKMDVYCEDSISFRTKQDFNFYADRDINFEAGRNVNIKATSEMQIETGKDYNLLIGSNGKIMVGQSGPTPGTGNLETNTKGFIYETSGGANHTNAGGNIVETAPAIHMNGPQATTATKPHPLTQHKVADLSKQDGEIATKETIVRRLPTPEPYPQHENIDPLKYKPEKTDRDAEGRYGTSPTSTMEAPGEYWKKYSTSTDTFAKVGK